MKLSLSQTIRDEATRLQFEDWLADISAGWGEEHTPEGLHLKVTAEGNIISTGGWSHFGGQLGCKLGLPANQTIPPGLIETPIIWNLPTTRAVGSRGGVYDNGQTATRGRQFLQKLPSGQYGALVMPEPGLYLLTCQVKWQAAGSVGARQVHIRNLKTAGTHVIAASTIDTLNPTPYTHQFTVVIPIAGDEVDTANQFAIYATNTDPAPVAIEAGYPDGPFTWVQITKIG